jgi:predicted transposase/invertase (TIGR01784 family)
MNKSRKTEKEKLELVKKLRPIDDVFFEVMMEDADTCEEILQVILENPRLKLKKETVVGQKSIRIVGKRSLRVDAYAEGHRDRIYNLEVQKSNNDNHVKRVRYHASALTVKCSQTGDKFGQVREIYIIYISDFDVLKNGRTVSHARMTCEETGKGLEDGLHEIYVTTRGKEDSKPARLMQEFLNPDMNNPEFPKTSKRVQELKNSEEEVEKMCELVEEYAAKRVEEAEERAAKRAKGAAKESAGIYFRNGGTMELAMKMFGILSKKELAAIQKKVSG